MAGTKPSDVTIAVMGATGTGKSTFINLTSGSALKVGRGLRSCTSVVEVSKTFDVNGVNVTLVDTPGFDDTTISDTDILKMIGVFLSTSFEQGHKLSGIIYMHRITDHRMGGISRKNFGMFRKLCGDKTLKNVLIVTNMWGDIEPHVGEAREVELQTDDLLFKAVLDRGAHMRRHLNTRESALTIIQELIKNHPEALRIQTELVVEKKKITETDACKEIDKEREELIRKHKEEMDELRAGLNEAVRLKDEQTRKELEEAKQLLESRMAEMEEKRANLSREYEEEKAATAAVLLKMQVNLEDEIKKGQEQQAMFEEARVRHEEETARAIEQHEVSVKAIEQELQQAFAKQQDELKTELQKDLKIAQLELEAMKSKREADEQRFEQEREALQMKIEWERQELVKNAELAAVKKALQDAQAQMEAQRIFGQEQAKVRAEEDAERRIKELERDRELARMQNELRMRQMESKWKEEQRAMKEDGRVDQLRKQVELMEFGFRRAQEEAEIAKAQLIDIHHNRRGSLNRPLRLD